MSNVPIPPSPGPSRPRPSYSGYQPPQGGSFYENGEASPIRFRGDSWRAEPSYRPRDPNADHYEPEYDDDRSRFSWGTSYPHSQTYDPSPDPWPRRDVMAERMFEPSDSWKHDHAPDSELDISGRFSEVRDRMPPPREDYVYTYGGDSYRAVASYTARRDSSYQRQSDYYRPGYVEEGRWSTSFSLDDASSSWARQRSPSSTATSRLPRGRLDYRDVSYEKSFSGSPRSSRFSSPRHSRAGASRRAHSPSSSSIRSSRERSKSPPRSRDHSRSSIRSSTDSHSYTADPPVRPQVQRSLPVGQSRGRRRGGGRIGMRVQADGFREPVAPPFVPPLSYPNELRPEDRFAAHPSLPLRPSSPSLNPGLSGRNRFSERGFAGLPQIRYTDPQAGRASPLIPNTNQQGYPLARSKRKRRGGVNRKKRGVFHPQGGLSRDAFSDSNATPFPQSGPRGFAVPPVPLLAEEFKASKNSFIPTALEYQILPPVTSGEPPALGSFGPEMGPSLAIGDEPPPLATLKLEESTSSLTLPTSSAIADTGPPGNTGEELSLTSVDKQKSPPSMTLATPELPQLVIPPPEPPVEPPLAQHGLLGISQVNSPSQSQSTLFSPVPARPVTPPLPPSEPPSEPSMELCSTPQSIHVNGFPEVTTSSPVSSVAPTPSLQTPSPPHVVPEVIVAAPTVREPEDELMPASPVSSALQAIGVPSIVRSERGNFPAHAKEAGSLTDALCMVVSARQQLDVQSREERVNPILMSNRAVAIPCPGMSAPLGNTFVQEILAGQRAKNTVEAFHFHVRDSLVVSMAARQETIDEKVARLRKEYLALHREWVARCAELDNSHRADPAAGEVSAIPARTTRRSAAVLGDAVRSDLEMEQIIASLGNDELYDPAHLALRNLAVIPDMISVTCGKVDAVFDDTNNLVSEPQSFFDPSPGLAEWTDDEVEIFKQRFAKYPKQFGHIAAGLSHKTQAQCVQFYYLHKKALIDFREAIATYGQSKRRRGGRKTDKKKGGLLADIRQHDAEVSKEKDPVKRRAGTSARKRRESARTAPRRSITTVQHEEQTPVTTPTPEPELESARPKRRRNNRPAAEPEPVGAEEPPPKRSRRAPRKPKTAPESSTSEQTPLSRTTTEAPNGVPEVQNEHAVQRCKTSAWSADDIDLFMGLLAQYGKDFKRIAASMPNKTTIQVGNFYASNLDRYNLSTIAAQAPGRSPTPNLPQEDKKDSSEPVGNIPSGNHERSFAIGNVPPISATSRSHLINLQSHPFSISGPSSGSTLHLYS